MSRAIKDPAREVGEQAFLTLRDAGCVKGMMGSMYLEERIFSPEVPVPASRDWLVRQAWFFEM